MKTAAQIVAERKAAQQGVSQPQTINLGGQVASATPQVSEAGINKINSNIAAVKRPIKQGLGWVSDTILQPIEYASSGMANRFLSENEKLKGTTGENPWASSLTPKGAWESIKKDVGNIIGGAKEGLEKKLTTQDIDLTRRAGGLSEEDYNPVAGAISNFGASVAIPSVPILKVGKLLKINKLAPKALQLAEKTPGLNKVISGVKNVAEQFSWEKSAPEDFLRRWEQYLAAKSKVAGRAEQVANPLMFDATGRKLSTLEQKQLGDVIEMTKGTLKRAVTPEESKIIERWKPTVDKLRNDFVQFMDEQIKAGADPAIFERWANNYFGKGMYGKYLKKSGDVLPYAKKSGAGIDTGIYKKKIEYMPEEMQTELEKIQEPAFGAATAAYASGMNVETMKLFKWIAKKYVNKGDDLVELPKLERLGILAGQKVPKKIAAYINQSVKYIPGLTDRTDIIGKAARAYSGIIKGFKEAKTILSPTQLLRNIPASQMQAYMNPSGRSDSIRRIFEAIGQYRSKGKYYKELQNMGKIGQNFPSEVLNKFIPEELNKFKTTSNLYEKAKKLGGAWQNAVEDITKLQVYINERKAGRSVMDAAKMAEETGFNYQKVSPLVKELRKGPLPFITYPMKAAGLTGKTLLQNPQRLKNVGSAERAIQGLSTADQEQFLPDYQKDAVRLPFKNPKTGKPVYINAKYLYPWGNLIEGGTPFGITPDPIVMEIASQAMDRDAYQMLQKIMQGQDPGTVAKISDNELLGLPASGRVRHLVQTFTASPIKTIFNVIDSLTANPKTATDPSAVISVLKEAGLPLFEFNPELGASIQEYQYEKKLADLDADFTKAVDKYAGKPLFGPIMKIKTFLYQKGITDATKEYAEKFPTQ